ncbi:hypothetical protein AALP_AAs72154U000100, partial [Arabis alpina]
SGLSKTALVKLFAHNELLVYKFNPLDEDYFTSGSLDARSVYGTYQTMKTAKVTKERKERIQILENIQRRITALTYETKRSQNSFLQMTYKSKL